MCGGQDCPTRQISSVEMYDTRADTWCELKDMPRKRAWAACAFIEVPERVLSAPMQGVDPHANTPDASSCITCVATVEAGTGMRNPGWSLFEQKWRLKTEDSKAANCEGGVFG